MRLMVPNMASSMPGEKENNKPELLTPRLKPSSNNMPSTKPTTEFHSPVGYRQPILP